MSLKVFILTLLALICQQQVMGQCCSAGNPFFYGEQSSMGHKELQVIGGYKYSTSTSYFEGSEPISIDFVDKAYFNYLNLQLQYGITHRFSIQTDLGYFINKTETYSKAGWDPNRGYGLGDLMLTVRYLAYKNFVRKLSIIPSIGVKFPIGVFDQEVNHVKLPITVQPSSGSFKYLFNLYVNKGFSSPKWNLGFFASFEYAQLINSQNFYYKYGNLYLFSFITSYKVIENINLGIEIRSENRARSSREIDQLVESSGYNIIYTIPHISYSFAKKWLLSVNAELPVYRHYNGIQLGNSFSVSARLSYRINFNKPVFSDININ